MIAFADAGITTFDCADIYTGVEELIGAFRQRYPSLRGAEALARIRVHTKFVPDLDLLPRLTRPTSKRVIDRSLRRLRTERLDLVQFHWWDYAVPRLARGGALAGRTAQGRQDPPLGGTNFDTEHMPAIVDAGVPLRLDAGAVFAARPPPGEGDARGRRRATASRCSATAPSPAASSATAGSAAPSRPSRSRTAR